MNYGTDLTAAEVKAFGKLCSECKGKNKAKQLERIALTFLTAWKTRYVQDTYALLDLAGAVARAEIIPPTK